MAFLITTGKSLKAQTIQDVNIICICKLILVNYCLANVNGVFKIFSHMIVLKKSRSQKIPPNIFLLPIAFVLC